MAHNNEKIEMGIFFKKDAMGQEFEVEICADLEEAKILFNGISVGQGTYYRGKVTFFGETQKKVSEIIGAGCGGFALPDSVSVIDAMINKRIIEVMRGLEDGSFKRGTNYAPGGTPIPKIFGTSFPVNGPISEQDIISAIARLEAENKSNKKLKEIKRIENQKIKEAVSSGEKVVIKTWNSFNTKENCVVNHTETALPTGKIVTTSELCY
jgi:hypothetical protein